MHFLASIFLFFWKIIRFIVLGFCKVCWFYAKFVICFFVILFSLVFIVGIFAGESDVPAPTDHKLLLIRPTGLLTDHHAPELNNLMNNIADDKSSFSYSDEIIAAISGAMLDHEYVQGIVIDLSSLAYMDYGIANSIGKAIKNYKSLTKKPVYVYSDTYTQRDYYLATFGSNITLNPSGDIDISGITVGQPYFKELLDNWGVTPLVFKCGKYKSAVEPFINKSMSAESRENLTSIIDDMWQSISSVITSNRKINPQDLLRGIDTELNQLEAIKFDYLQDLKNRKLVDNILSAEEFNLLLKKDFPKARFAGTDKLALINYSDYLVQSHSYDAGLKDTINSDSNNIIQVVYMTGDVSSSGEGFYISYDNYKSEFDRIAADKNIKVVVLRVNTPGGAVNEGIKITNAISNLKKQGKIVVVSMGNVAASAGYMISAGANWIVAEPTTLTGSIGVFGIVPVFNTIANKNGIYYDEVSNNPNHFSSSLQEMDERQHKLITGNIDYIYDYFLNVVANGRNMKVEKVHEIAQGRVWTGKQALDIGLVDQIGSLDDAVEKGATLAQIGSDYKVESFYSNESMQLDFMKGFLGKNSSARIILEYLAGFLPKTVISQFEMLMPTFNGIPQDKNAHVYSYLPLEVN